MQTAIPGLPPKSRGNKVREQESPPAPTNVNSPKALKCAIRCADGNDIIRLDSHRIGGPVRIEINDLRRHGLGRQGGADEVLPLSSNLGCHHRCPACFVPHVAFYLPGLTGRQTGIGGRRTDQEDPFRTSNIISILQDNLNFPTGAALFFPMRWSLVGGV